MSPRSPFTWSVNGVGQLTINTCLPKPSCKLTLDDVISEGPWLNRILEVILLSDLPRVARFPLGLRGAIFAELLPERCWLGKGDLMDFNNARHVWEWGEWSYGFKTVGGRRMFRYVRKNKICLVRGVVYG